MHDSMTERAHSHNLSTDCRWSGRSSDPGTILGCLTARASTCRSPHAGTLGAHHDPPEPLIGKGLRVSWAGHHPWRSRVKLADIA